MTVLVIPHASFLLFILNYGPPPQLCSAEFLKLSSDIRYNAKCLDVVSSSERLQELVDMKKDIIGYDPNIVEISNLGKVRNLLNLNNIFKLNLILRKSG